MMNYYQKKAAKQGGEDNLVEIHNHNLSQAVTA